MFKRDGCEERKGGAVMAAIKPRRLSRRTAAGEAMADSLIEWIHMMYQKQTARGVLKALIERLRERQGEFE